MAAPDSTIRLSQVGLEQSIENAIKKVNASGRLKLNINSNSFTQPLGRITAATDEFTKSIEASNARVIAFGASVGVINAISNAFKSLVKETVALEQRLTEVNVVLGANADQLKSFGKELFNIARNTSQSFDAVSQAALEFSRQGLSVEETLKRTNDALILSRLTGLKAADSVKGLTATMNSFAQAGLSTAEVINKLAAVDVKFAVSSEDLINALSRAGSVAQDAGLNFDELIAAVTSAQQTTARGGAVIGNSFKTIFTRIQRSDTLDRLQELGIAVRNVQGETLPAMMILQQLAKSYDGLTDATKSAVAEQVGGVFQINILKAALRDLNNENSIYSRAVLTSAGATDQAITKNEQLNKTLDSLSKQTITSVQELSAAIGEITVGPGIEKVLNAINNLSQGASKLLDGEGIGSTLANGVLKGLGTVISGPGLILIGGLMLKLFVDTTKFAASSFKNLLGLNKKSQEQKALQDSILATLQSNRQISAVLAQLEGNKAAQSKFLLDQVQKTTTEYTKQVNLAKQLAASLGQAGVVGGAGGLSVRTGRRAAHGFIPNFSAEGREMMDIKKGVGGVSPSAKPVRLKNFNMGGGRIGDMVANSQEYYVKNFNGRGGDAVFNPDMVQKYGMPYGAKKINAANGYIPNFAGGGLGVAAGSFKAVSQQFAGQSVPAFLKGKTGTQVAYDYKNIAAGYGSDDKILEASRSLDSAGRFWGLKALGVNEEDANSIRKKAKDIKANRNKNPIKIVVDAQKGKNSTGYGVVTVENVGTTKLNSFPDIVPSKVFEKADFDKTVRFDLNNIAVASVSSQTDPELSELIDEEVFRSVESIANKLIGSHELTENVNKDRIELSDVLDKSAGPQLKGRMFESIVDYMALRLAKDRGDVPTKTANQLFDYEKGIPKQLNEVFSNPENILDDLKIDAKASMSTGSSGPGSMVKKILEDKLSGGAKEKIREKIRKLPESQRVLNFSSGYIPNFAGGVKVSDIPALSDSVMREKAAGVPSSAIRINTDKRLKNSGNPNGLAVTNVIDEPRGMRDVFAANGYIPNFAPIPNVTQLSSDQIKGIRGKSLDTEIENQEQLLRKYNLILNQTIQSTEEYQKEIDKAAQNTSDLKSQKGDINKKQSDIRAEKKLNERKIAELQKEIRSGTGGGYTTSTQTRAKKQELANLLGQNTKLKQEDVKLSQQSNALSRQILESQKAEQKAQVHLARTTEAQAKAADRKLIAERNAENLTSARNQRSESRGAAMQNFGLQAAFIVPMLTASIEQGMFKGMERAEMTRGERRAQAALQGVGEGAGFASIVGNLLSAFGNLHPAVKIAAVAFAGLAPVIKRFIDAGDLTADELIAQNEKRKQAANDELAAAEQILNARKILADPANYSQNELDAASKTLRDNFAKIKDVNLQQALLANKFSFENATEAVKNFAQEVGTKRTVFDAINAFNQLKGLKANNLEQRSNASDALVTAILNTGRPKQELIDALSAVIGVKTKKVMKDVDEFIDMNNVSVQAEDIGRKQEVTEYVLPKSRTQEIEELRKQLIEQFSLKINENAAKDMADLLIEAIKDSIGKVDFQQELGISFRSMLFDRLKKGKDLLPKVTTSIELKSKAQEYIQSINDFTSKTLSEASKEISQSKLKISITEELNNFQLKLAQGIIPDKALEAAKTNINLNKIDAEYENFQNQFVKDNIGEISTKLQETFKSGGDFGLAYSEALQELFVENPRAALTELEKISKGYADLLDESLVQDARQQIESYYNNILKKFKQEFALSGDNDIITPEQLNQIDKGLSKLISMTGQGMTYQQIESDITKQRDELIEASNNYGMGELLQQVQKSENFQGLKELIAKNKLILEEEDQNTKDRKAVEALRGLNNQIEKENARLIRDIQTEAADKIRTLNVDLARSAADLRRDTGELQRQLEDPRQKLGGLAEIDRQDQIKRQIIQKEEAQFREKQSLELEQKVAEIFKDEKLIQAMLSNEISLDTNTDALYELTKAVGAVAFGVSSAEDARNELGELDKKQDSSKSDILRLNSAEKFYKNLEKSKLNADDAKATLQSFRENSPQIQSLMLEAIKGNKSPEQFIQSTANLAGLQPGSPVLDKYIEQYKELLIQIKLNNIELEQFEERRKNQTAETGGKKFETTFEAGRKSFFNNLDTELDSFGFKIGSEFPAAFRDNMTQAFSAIINNADNLGDTLLGIANQFLQTMQQAFLQQASGQAMSFFGFGKYNGGPIKKYANGGAVSNNAVPAMVTNGEYVIGKDAASRLGPEKLEMLNNGTFPMDGYASGGKVSTKSREAYSKHMQMFGTSFDDTKSAKFYNSLWQEVPKAQREVALKQAADQETESEIKMKEEQRRQRRAQIIGLIGSAALAFGMSKLVSSANLSALNSGQAASLKLPGISEGISGKMVQGSGFVPSSLNNLSLDQIEAVDMFNSQLGGGKLTSSFLKDQGATFDLIKNKYNGGPIQAYASGGQVRGPAGRDVIPAVLTEGEYVIKASSARKYGKRFLDNLNQGGRAYYNGGSTSNMQSNPSQNFNLNMNFDVNQGGESSARGVGSGDKSQDQGINQFAQNIRKLVQEEIQKEQRVGGLLRGTRR